MKSCWFLLLAALFFACNEQPEKLAASPPQPLRDSNRMPRAPLTQGPSSPDLSPMDVIYFPLDYPVLKMTQKAKPLPVVRVIYSRPHKQGRKIFGELIPYGEPWRLGANEATEIELFQTVQIQNKPVAAGKYVLYCIPEEAQWTIVFNSNIYSWGLKPDPAKDVYRFTIPTSKTERAYEFFTMSFENAKYGTTLAMSWDDITARLPITVQ